MTQRLINIQILIVFFISFLISLSSAIADSDSGEVHLNKLNVCTISPKVTNDYEPEEFQKTNNLLRKPGQAPMFCGERIIVYGKLLDQNCVPISDAKIYAWQVGCDGKYPYEPLKTFIDKEFVKMNPELSFVGNGTATTNNKGEFHFVTIYPKAVHDISPHVNIKVVHKDLGSFNTRLVLRGKKLNKPLDEPELGRMVGVAYDMGSNIYDFQIVMPGETSKHY